jgi:enoyl-CoA hydratase/carnithine racemase
MTAEGGSAPGTPGPDVIVERHGPVLLLRMNRPDRHNAVGGTLFRDLADAFDEAGRDDSIRVVVTTGAGSSFCVGADVADFPKVAELPARELLSSSLIGGEKGLPVLSADELVVEELGNAGRWTLRMWALEKPAIAAINGTAVGGGFGLALLHDIRVAADSARLGTGFAAAGLAPELGMSLLLPQAVGASKAAELFFTGQLLRAAEARELGVVSEVVPAAELTDRAMELAGQIAGMPPLGLRLSKRLLRRAAGDQLADALRSEYAAQVRLFDHAETRAALVALTERVTRRSAGG